MEKESLEIPFLVDWKTINLVFNPHGHLANMRSQNCEGYSNDSLEGVYNLHNKLSQQPLHIMSQIIFVETMATLNTPSHLCDLLSRGKFVCTKNK